MIAEGFWLFDKDDIFNKPDSNHSPPSILALK